MTSYELLKGMEARDLITDEPGEVKQVGETLANHPLFSGASSNAVSVKERTGSLASGKEQDPVHTTAPTPVQPSPIIKNPPPTPAAGLMKKGASVVFPVQAKDHHQGMKYLTDLTAVFGDKLPTVTKKTLRELNLETISSSVQLRHDMLFDPNLEFRPNDDGMFLKWI